MKTNIHPGFLKVSIGLLVALFLVILLLAYAQMAQTLIASVGWVG